MNFEDVVKKQEEIIQKIFEDKSLIIKPETMATDVNGWDSLIHIRIIIEIEKAFKIKFNLGEIRKVQNVGEMAELILNKIS